MRDERSGVTNHPAATLTLLGICAWGAWLVNGVGLGYGAEHGLISPGSVLTAAALAAAAAIAFPVWVAAPLLGGVPTWARAAVWTVYGAASLGVCGQEAGFFAVHGPGVNLVHLSHARARRAMTVPPRVQALRAVERGDSGFLAVEGFATRVPGVENFCTYGRRGFRSVEGTGDVMSGPDDVDFQIEATRYARSYNRVIAERLHIPPGELAPLPRSFEGPCLPPAAHHGDAVFPVPADMR
jgi:hypothetical protein